MSRLLKQVLHGLGFELRRLPDPQLPRRHDTMFDGQPLSLWLVDSSTNAWWGKPEIEMKAEYRGLKSLCAPGDVVLDVGGHHGMTTIPFSRWVGENGAVHSFEANPANAVVLQANVGLNQARNVVCVHRAVGSGPGTVMIAGESVNGAAGLPQKVTVTSLDDYCEQQALSRVDLIKIDVEGFEAEVLKGAKSVLGQNPKVALELHLDLLANFGGSVRDVRQSLGLDEGRYRMTAMIRPDWELLRPLASFDELPQTGVVNLFFQPSVSK